MIDFEYFKVFYFVARDKNITRAAEDMYMSQPAVTKIIRSLESQLQCELMTRSKKGIELTSAGLRFFNMIASSCETLISIEHSIENSDLFSDSLKISMNPVFCDLIMDTLMTYRKQYPEIDIEIDSDIPEMKKQYLKSKSRDIIIDYEGVLSTDKDQKEQSEGWEKTVIGANQEKAYVGEGMAKLFEPEVTLDELTDYPLIVTNFEHISTELSDRLNSKDISQIKTIQLSCLDMQKTMAAMNEGVLLTSEISPKEDIASEGLICLKLKDPLPENKIILYSPEENRMSKSARIFCKMLLNKLDLAETDAVKSTV